jgi:hypothetical protein
VEVYFHHVLDSAIGGGERVVSLPVAFIPRNSPLTQFRGELVEQRQNHSEYFGKRKISFPCQEMN